MPDDEVDTRGILKSLDRDKVIRRKYIKLLPLLCLAIGYNLPSAGYSVGTSSTEPDGGTDHRQLAKFPPEEKSLLEKKLPEEIIEKIADYLPIKSLLNLRSTNVFFDDLLLKGTPFRKKLAKQYYGNPSSYLWDLALHRWKSNLYLAPLEDNQERTIGKIVKRTLQGHTSYIDPIIQLDDDRLACIFWSG